MRQRRKWQPTPVLLLGESGGAWWAAIYEVAQSRTRLMRLSSSSGLSVNLKLLIYFARFLLLQDLSL